MDLPSLNVVFTYFELFLWESNQKLCPPPTPTTLPLYVQKTVDFRA